jgi:hypothetical protein
MGYSINAHDVPALRSYAEALRHHDNIKPIRNLSPELRPINNTGAGRRKPHMRIDRTMGRTPHTTTTVQGVAAVLYNTPVVTWYEDGTTRLYTGGHNSQSTAAFMQRFLPGYVTGAGSSCLRWVTQAHGTIKIDNELWLDASGSPIDPDPFVVHRINRHAKKEVTKQYAAFMQYAVARGRLTEWRRDPYAGGYRTPQDLADLMASEALEDHAAAYLSVVGEIGQWKWTGDEAAFERYMTDLMLRLYGDDILTRIALPIGEYKKDSYAIYAR